MEQRRPPRPTTDLEEGVDAVALGYQDERSSVREVFARVKAIWDAAVDTPVTAGKRIPIQTSDGRESWGPAPPPGTPPAGSPDSSGA